MNEAAFTLIEILVTVALFALGVLALATLQVLSIKGTAFNKEASVATGLAQQAIEDFKNLSFGNTSSYCGAVQNGMTVTCATATSGSSPYRFNDITVTVTWGTPTKQISLYTITAEH